MINGFTLNGADLDTVLVPRSYFNQGTLWSWGTNNYGQFGDNTLISKSSPVQTISAGINWKQISAAYGFTSGIKTDGTLWGWGVNNMGGLGTGNLIARSSPVQTASGTNTWAQVDCGTTIGGGSTATASGSTAAVKTNGQLWMWGKNNYGQLGDNTTINKSSPVQTIAGAFTWRQVATNSYGHCGAIKTDGTLWMWGYNVAGQLGINSTINQSSPTQTVAGAVTWRSLSMGSFSTAAIKTDGTLWLWGRNSVGQLGNNTSANQYSSPIQTIAGGNNWKQVALSSIFFNSQTTSRPGVTAAIKTDGTLWVWGGNNYGQLGDNTLINQSSPVQTISAGTNWKQVSVNTYVIASVKTDGTLWTWGDNTYGQLGDNTLISKSSPIQTIASGYNWNSVSCGYKHVAATVWVY
jgi:alpha-tubulin suppressor-like RCC1 family protein